MKKAISKIINVISIVLMAGAVIILLSSVLTVKGGIPSIGGYSVFRVVTGSMESTIPTDTLIVIERLDEDDDETAIEKKIKKNDIISFYSSDPEIQGVPVTHRVVGIEKIGGETAYTTKGDANAVEDDTPVYASDVIGKLVWQSHTLGVIVKLMLNPLFFFPVIILPLLIMIILNLKTSISETRRIMGEETDEAIREAIEAAKKKKAEEEKEDKEDKEDKENGASENIEKNNII